MRPSEERVPSCGGGTPHLASARATTVVRSATPSFADNTIAVICARNARRAVKTCSQCALEQVAMAWKDGSRFNIVSGIKWGTGPKVYKGSSKDTPWNHVRLRRPRTWRISADCCADCGRFCRR